MDEQGKTLAAEVEGAASVVSPLPLDVIAAALGTPESEIVAVVEALEADGRVTSSRLGVSAMTTSLSATRLAHVAGRIAEELERRDASPAMIGRARWAAGDARRAYDAFRAALDDEDPREHFEILDAAITAAREARVPKNEIAGLLVDRGRMRRNRGEGDLAVADLEEALPHLAHEPLVDALGFAAALHDDRQHPADAERTIAMALLVAASEGMDAKLGSLLTFQGRVLARLGFDAESEHVFTRGSELIERHGTDVQRYFATVNQGWTDLDRGWASRAERRYSVARAQAETIEDRVAAAEMDIAIARAKFVTGDGTGAMEALDAARRVAADTDAPALAFLATLAEAEGAISFRQGEQALDAAQRLSAIVSESFPSWTNRAAAVEARASLVARRPAEARAAVERGLETTPPGANGMRVRTELEGIQLIAAERWDDERAADVADRLLQGGWLLAAASLLTERARRERKPELARTAAALAHRLGAPLVAAEAIEVAGLWKDPASGPVALAIQRVARTVPEEWSERWRALPAIEHALTAEFTADASSESELLDHLESALAQVGLGGGGVVLSPAQRRSAGLVSTGSVILSMGKFVGWVLAAAVVAAVVAVALRPEPVEVPVAVTAPTTAPTTTIPPLGQRIVEMGSDTSGQSPFAGGESRNAFYSATLGDPTGIFWSSQVTGFVRSDPVLRGRTLYVGDSEGYVYGLDVAGQASVIFESQMSGGIGTSLAVDQVAFGQDAQGKVLAFAGDASGRILVRHINDTEGEVWETDLGSPITGPTLVRELTMIVATEEGVLYEFLPSDGTELRRFPEEGTVEGGFSGPLAAADGVIYARTGEGAILVIDEATFTEICSVFTPTARFVTHPVVADGQWYAGTSARSVRTFGAGGCSNAGVGSFQIDTPVLFAPVVADGVMWTVADALLLPLDIETGQGTGFVFPAGRSITSPPVVAGDVVLVGTDAGDLVAVDRADGTEAWRFPLGSVLRTRPVVGNGIVIVATARGDIIAIAAPPG